MSEIIILDNDNGNNTVDEKKQKSLYDIINGFIISFTSKVDIKEKAAFFRLTAVMLDSGMTIIKAITTLQKQEKKENLKRLYGDIVTMLKSGKPLSNCLEEYPNIFGDSEVGMVRAGEKTGRLYDSLIRIAEQIEKLSSFQGKLKSALVYPAVIMVVVIGVIIIMMTMVVPKLIVMFGDKEQLPAATKLLINMSDFMVEYGLLLGVICVGLFLLFQVWKRTKGGTMFLDNLTIKIPKFGDMYKKFILSKFARVFSNLFASGISIVESLKIVSTSVGNEIYRQRILLIVEDVKSGIKIYESIDGDELFPDMLTQMIQVGEQTATLDRTIVKVADFYDEEFDNMVSNINKLIEPIIIVFLAVTVGFIAIAIMQPILGLANQITGV